MSLGSLSELSVIFRLARDLEYLDAKSWEDLDRLRNHAGVLTWRLYRAVKDNGR
jgi:hypothetical protein